MMGKKIEYHNNVFLIKKFTFYFIYLFIIFKFNFKTIFFFMFFVLFFFLSMISNQNFI